MSKNSLISQQELKDRHSDNPCSDVILFAQVAHLDKQLEKSHKRGIIQSITMKSLCFEVADTNINFGKADASAEKRGLNLAFPTNNGKFTSVHSIRDFQSQQELTYVSFTPWPVKVV